MTQTLSLPDEILKFLASQVKPGSTQIQQIAVSSIFSSPNQPRRNFDPEELSALAQSISNCGILQPLVVREVDNGYILVAGERRLRAAAMLGMTEVPCILYERTDEECALATMIENLQRQDLSFWEEAQGYKLLLDKFSYTQEELAGKMGKTQSTIANKLRLLRLSPKVQRLLATAGCSERHARALLQIGDEQTQLSAAQTIIERSYNVTQAEHYIESICTPKPPKSKPTALVRDRRICRNTLEHAIGLIRKAGIKATSRTNENDTYIEYVIRIPKA